MQGKQKKMMVPGRRMVVMLFMGLIGLLFGVGIFARGGSGEGGEAEQFLIAWLTVLERALLFSWPAFVYLVAALGLGTAVVRALRERDESSTLVIQHESLSVVMGVGISLQLAITLAGGWAGAIGTVLGAWALVVPGLALLALQRAWVWKRLRTHWVLADVDGERYRLMGPLVVGWLVAIGVIFAAAASMPGVLWKSEFGGYDALSYHLQLPQEWLANGGVETVSHNVYSALPSGLEAAFAHVTKLAGASSMVGRDGLGLFATQFLHAMIGVLGACGVASLARRVALALGYDALVATTAAGTAGLLVLATPWVIVVSSLAYNEMGVVLGLATCGIVLVQAWETLGRWPGEISTSKLRSLRLHAVRIGTLLAILVGGACVCKPTAMLFVGIPVGVVLLLMAPGSLWSHVRWGWLATIVCAGGLIGLGMLAPWMGRNWAATENPVFPFASVLFARADGSMGWWSAEQVSRFAASHRFDGSLIERLKLMVVAEASDPSAGLLDGGGAGGGERARGGSHRGLLHRQWGPWLILSCVVGMVVMPVLAMLPGMLKNERRGRAVWMVTAVVMFVQLALWLFTTHIQSRFLLPMVVPMAVVLGVGGAIGAGRFPAQAQDRSSVMRNWQSVLCLLPLLWLFLSRGAMGVSNLGLVFTPDDRMGVSAAARQIGEADKSSEQLINTQLPAGSLVLLVGEATPLYYEARKVKYATTWDTNPLSALLAEHGADDAKVAAALHERGFTHVLVHFAELDRLQRSGFLDSRLEPGRVAEFIKREGMLVRQWEMTGQVLVRLRH